MCDSYMMHIKLRNWRQIPIYCPPYVHLYLFYIMCYLIYYLFIMCREVINGKEGLISQIERFANVKVKRN